MAKKSNGKGRSKNTTVYLGDVAAALLAVDAINQPASGQSVIEALTDSSRTPAGKLTAGLDRAKNAAVDNVGSLFLIGLGYAAVRSAAGRKKVLSVGRFGLGL